MSKLVIEINTDNDAFGDNPKIEIARILRLHAKKIEDWGIEDRPILDRNGNKVGSLKYFESLIS